MADSPDSQRDDPIFDKYPEDSEDRSLTNETPMSEVSPPESPSTKHADLLQPSDKRANARKLAASLTLQEQVRQILESVTGILCFTDRD